MYRTAPLQKGGRLASTRAGMRRVLKKLPPLTTYIRKAVETGVYRSNEEIEEAMRNLRNSYQGISDDAPDVVVNNFRRNFKRGISVMDYPPEYHILSLHPPIPDPPRIPKKLQRKMMTEQEAHPAESLVRKALQRTLLSSQQQPQPSDGETYYQNLLGIPPPPADSAMGQKSALLSRSYAMAMKQYELMRTQEMSEREALEEVDRLLAQEAKEESEQSRSVAESIQEYYANDNVTPPRQETWGGKLDHLKDDNPNESSTNSSEVFSDYTFSQEQNGNVDLTSIPSILHSKPRTLQGMMQWSDMLRQVPYQQWTIGASTALDHWIARNVLQLSEETWEDLLEGNDPSLLSRGRDVVAVRETLFPETRLDVSSASRHEEEAAAMEMTDATETTSQEEERSIDDLLESLRGLDNKVTSPDELSGKVMPVVDEMDEDEIDTLVRQLQEWRTMNVESPYESWSPEEQTEFSAWLEKYVKTLTSPQDRSVVDMDETRMALLASPPVQSKEESDSFWKNLQDETMADVFLQKLLADGPPADATATEKEFWSLSYQQQLSKIVELGAVRPMLDEYATDAERKDFMARYGDFLLEGVELEHLVKDPNGNIRATDFGMEMVRKHKLDSKDCFKLVKLPYKGSSDDSSLERGRALYYAWNQQKAGRARYEEAMFHQGELGLRYDDPPPRQLRNDEFKS